MAETMMPEVLVMVLPWVLVRMWLRFYLVLIILRVVVLLKAGHHTDNNSTKQD